MLTHTAGGRELVFVHIPKTAGLSVWKIVGRPHGVSNRLTHATVAQWRQGLGAARYDAAFSFAIVRHPCDRLLSAWSYLHGQKPGDRYYGPDTPERLQIARYGETFNEFALSMPKWMVRPSGGMVHFVSQADYLCVDGQPRVNRLLRFERLDIGWLLLMDECGAALLELPVTNRSRHGDWRDVVSADSERRIRELYADDFSLFYPGE